MFPIQPKTITEIRFRSAGNAVWGILAATTGDFEIPRNPIIPSYILSGKKWKKLDFKVDGSKIVIDRSMACYETLIIKVEK